MALKGSTVHPRRGCLGLLFLIVSSGCGDGQQGAPQGSPAGGNISGRERLGWAQPAPSATELASYRYALYVDGARRVLDNASCATAAGADGFECSAPLPSMTPGPHVLELAVFVTAGTSIVEGPKSAPLQVNVTGASSQTPSAPLQGGPVVSSDGLRLYTEILARNLSGPVDLAVAGDGRVVVAERQGRVAVFDGRSGSPVWSFADVPLPLRHDEEAAILSLALAPDFASSGHLLVAYLTAGQDQATLRVARFRYVAGTLGETAIVSSHPVPDGATAVIRMGPDGHLYLAIGTGARSHEAQDAASSAGKILRLRPDGSTPDDNPWHSPAYSVGHRDPRGLAWQADGTLWEIERGEAGDELNLIQAGANFGWPVVHGGQHHPLVTDPALLLPDGTESTGLTAVPPSGTPLAGDLIVSTRGARDLLRITLGADRRSRRTSRLLQGHFGRVGQVASGPDGSVYLITTNEEDWGTGHDLLVRVRP